MSDLSQLTSLEHLHACWLKSRICKRRSLRAQTKRLKDMASKAAEIDRLTAAKISDAGIARILNVSRSTVARFRASRKEAKP
jgi:hypothetical protein